MNGMKQQPYQFQFTAANFSNPALMATLIDHFTNTRTPLSVAGTTVVPFTVTSVQASSDPGRFMVVFGPNSPLAVSDITINAYSKDQGIQVDWVTRTEFDMDRYEVERSADGILFYKAASKSSLGNNTNPTHYGWFDPTPFYGADFYRIRAVSKSGQVQYSNIVKVVINKTSGGISVYPNPIVGNKFNLSFTNMAPGTYDICLFSSTGQKVFGSQVQHHGGSAVHAIEPANNLPAGVYELLVTGTGVKITTSIIKD